MTKTPLSWQMAPAGQAGLIENQCSREAAISTVVQWAECGRGCSWSAQAVDSQLRSSLASKGRMCKVLHFCFSIAQCVCGGGGSQWGGNWMTHTEVGDRGTGILGSVFVCLWHGGEELPSLVGCLCVQQHTTVPISSQDHSETSVIGNLGRSAVYLQDSWNCHCPPKTTNLQLWQLIRPPVALKRWHK